MLLNEHVAIRHGDGAVVLAGVTDKVAARTGQPMPDIAAALAGVSPEGVILLLSHRPLAPRQTQPQVRMCSSPAIPTVGTCTVFIGWCSWPMRDMFRAGMRSIECSCM